MQYIELKTGNQLKPGDELRENTGLESGEYKCRTPRPPIKPEKWSAWRKCQSFFEIVGGDLCHMQFRRPVNPK